MVRVEFDDSTAELVCRDCGHAVVVPDEAVSGGEVVRCLVCPSKELYVRKDFPQKLGLAIVVIGFAASCVPWYFHNWYGTFAILFATALIDVVLYMIMGNMLQCYRCQAQYRGVAALDERKPFNLETHEKYRQQAARLKETTRDPSANETTSRAAE